MVDERGGGGASSKSTEFFRVLFNGLIKQADLDLELRTFDLYIEKAVPDPTGEKDWKKELSRVVDPVNIPADSRLFVSAIARTQERDVPFLANLYYESDGKISAEHIIPYEVPVASEEEFKKRVQWQTVLDYVIRATPILWAILQYWLSKF